MRLKPVKPMRDQPDQSAWLKLAADEQAYWLLKLLNHYRDTGILAQPREKLTYQQGTMLIEVDGFNHHDPQVVSAVSDSSVWLINKGYLQQDPSQSNGIYKISSKGDDLIDLFIRPNDAISDLVAFVDSKNQLDTYDLEPMDILAFFSIQLEKNGLKPQQCQLDIDNRIAVNLSRLNNNSVSLESLQAAARYGLSRDWFQQRYMGTGTYGQWEITPAGLAYYDSNKAGFEATKNAHPQHAVKRTALTTNSSSGTPTVTSHVLYVNPDRIEELQKADNSKFDTARLVQLCHEINRSHEHHCFYAIAALVRTLIDHIPPIFNCKNFDEVANNYGGSKHSSFKKNMSNLRNSAKNISDRNLHQQIRNKEPLLNATQVDFSNDVDVLLQEIVVILN